LRPLERDVLLLVRGLLLTKLLLRRGERGSLVARVVLSPSASLA
jgi:hypothetical protein